MGARIALRLAGAGLLLSSAVRAGDGASGDGGEAKHPSEKWYGAQTLAADGGAMVIVIAEAVASGQRVAEDSSDGGGGIMLRFGGAVYLATTPVIHLVHGNGLEALGGFGLRLTLPFAGAGLGAEALSCANEDAGGFCKLGGYGLGFFAGMLGAIAIDAAWAWEDVEPPASSASIAPVLRLEHGERHFGVVGTF